MALRHIEALKSDYQVITIGYGPNPAGVFRHIPISDAIWMKVFNVRV